MSYKTLVSMNTVLKGVAIFFPQRKKHKIDSHIKLYLYLDFFIIEHQKNQLSVFQY